MKKTSFYTLRKEKDGIVARRVQGWKDGVYHYYCIGDSKSRTWYAIDIPTGRAIAQARTRTEVARLAEAQETSLDAIRATPKYDELCTIYSRAVFRAEGGDKMYKYSEGELDAMLCLKCDYLGQDAETLQDDIDNDCMTINRGHDGRIYARYLDEANNVICDIETLEIIDDEEIIDSLFC